MADHFAFHRAQGSSPRNSQAPRRAAPPARENASATTRQENSVRPSQVPVRAGTETVARLAADLAGRAARQPSFMRPSQVPALGGTGALADFGVRRALSEPGEPLDDGVRGWMEDRFGSDFSDVRVLRGTEAAASSRALGANAYTVGNRIAFAAGTYDPTSARGRHVLAHELAHVVQQRTGPVSGLPTCDGVTVSQPGDDFEVAAENRARHVMALPGASWAAQAPGRSVRATAGSRHHPAGVSAQGLRVATLSVQRNGERNLLDVLGVQAPNLAAGVLGIVSSGLSLANLNTAASVVGLLSSSSWTGSALISLVRAIWPQAQPEEIRNLPERVTKVELEQVKLLQLVGEHLANHPQPELFAAHLAKYPLPGVIAEHLANRPL